jgi:23S rRNA (pseudouridine1915-N3)-methyltransferase
MQLRVVAVGKVRERYVAAACEDFAKRLAPYYPLDMVEVKAALGAQPESAMREEGARILSALGDDDFVCLLDRTGEQLSSEELSRKLASIGNTGARRMVFVIAGTYGADPAVQRRAGFIWSLSKLTFLHEWARMIVLEQLYRAAKIARNEPYHH